MSSNPKSLGKVVVAAAGTPVALVSLATVCHQVTLQSDPSNVGTWMYVKDAAGNVMFKISKGQSASPPTGPHGVDLSQIKLDSDTNGDGCYVAYV